MESIIEIIEIYIDLFIEIDEKFHLACEYFFLQNILFKNEYDFSDVAVYQLNSWQNDLMDIIVEYYKDFVI